MHKVSTEDRTQSGAAAPHSKTQARIELGTAATFCGAAMLRRFCLESCGWWICPQSRRRGPISAAGATLRIHGGGVVAKATELIPCSRAALLTAMTSSYGV